MKALSSWLAFCLILLVTANGRSDSVTLKTGRVLRGVILKETKTEIILQLKFTTTTIKKSEIDAVDRTEPEGQAPNVGKRLPPWDRCLQVAAKQDWMANLEPIPATVIDKGILKNVPYKSFQSGLYEINIYGDPEQPAGLEIGIRGDLLKKQSAKNNCIDFITSLLSRSEDKEVIKKLNLAKDERERDGMNFEITPETHEDAYGGWWVSVYDKSALDKARASEKELRAITVRGSDVGKAEGDKEDEEHRWRRADLAKSRSGGGTVYVRGYTRKDGTYVQAHSRSAPSRR